jgi:hypothetical protein
MRLLVPFAQKSGQEHLGLAEIETVYRTEAWVADIIVNETLHKTAAPAHPWRCSWKVRVKPSMKLRLDIKCSAATARRSRMLTIGVVRVFARVPLRRTRG